MKALHENLVLSPRIVVTREHNRYAGDFNFSRERGLGRHKRDTIREQDLRLDLKSSVSEIACDYADTRGHDFDWQSADYGCDILELYESENRSAASEHDDAAGNDAELDWTQDDEEFDTEAEEESFFETESRRFDYAITYSYRNWY